MSIECCTIDFIQYVVLYVNDIYNINFVVKPLKKKLNIYVNVSLEV